MFSQVSKGKHKPLLNWALSWAGLKAHSVGTAWLSHRAWTYSHENDSPMSLMPQWSRGQGPQSIFFFFLLNLKCFLKVVLFCEMNECMNVVLRTVRNGFTLPGFCLCAWCTCSRALSFGLLETELSHFTFFINLRQCMWSGFGSELPDRFRQRKN